MPTSPIGSDFRQYGIQLESSKAAGKPKNTGGPDLFSSYTTVDSLFRKTISMPEVFICQRYKRRRRVKFQFSSSLKPTVLNLMRVIGQLQRTRSSKFGSILLKLYSNAKITDARIRWLKKHRKKVVGILFNSSSMKVRKWITLFVSVYARRMRHPDIQFHLVRALNSINPLVRHEAKWALMKMRNLSWRTFKKLSGYLKGSHKGLQLMALEVFSAVGNIPNRYAESALIRIAKNRRHVGRFYAIQALGRLKSKSSRSERMLIHLVKKDPNLAAKNGAIVAIVERGVRSQRVRAALKWCVKKGRTIGIIAQALIAMARLGNVDASTARKILIPNMTSPHHQVSAAALMALCHAPRRVVSKHVDTVADLIGDPSLDVRTQALALITYIKPRSVRVVKKIISKMNSLHWEVRLSAVVALANIGKYAKSYAVRALKRRRRKERNRQVKLAIKEALKYFANLGRSVAASSAGRTGRTRRTKPTRRTRVRRHSGSTSRPRPRPQPAAQPRPRRRPSKSIFGGSGFGGGG